VLLVYGHHQNLKQHGSPCNESWINGYQDFELGWAAGPGLIKLCGISLRMRCDLFLRKGSICNVLHNRSCKMWLGRLPGARMCLGWGASRMTVIIVRADSSKPLLNFIHSAIICECPKQSRGSCVIRPTNYQTISLHGPPWDPRRPMGPRGPWAPWAHRARAGRLRRRTAGSRQAAGGRRPDLQHNLVP